MTAAAVAAGEARVPAARDEHPGLALLLGLSPLLAVTDSVAMGLGLGLGTLAGVWGTNLLATALRRRIGAGTCLPAVLLVIAAMLGAAELLCKAFFFDSYLVVGAFLPMIIANGVILGRSTGAPDALPLPAALLRGWRESLGLALVLILVGGLRQLAGAGFALALAPAGAFLTLALLVAAWNSVARR